MTESYPLVQFPPLAKDLSKREYFAAMAMQGLLAGHYQWLEDGEIDFDRAVTEYAVVLADSLIAELK